MGRGWGGVEAVVADYLACPRGGRRAPVGRQDERQHDGTAEICGDVNGGALTFIRGGDQALVLLALGTPQQCVELYETLPRGRWRYWEGEPVAAVFAGTRRFFRALGGGRALGVIECDDRALVLGQVDGRLVLVLVQGATHVLICTAGIKDLGVVDVDAHMDNLPPRRPARGAPPAQVRQHHERITQGRELAQETSDVICMALQRLGLRVALAMDPARFGLRHRGKRAVMAFIDLLVTLGLLRCGDLCGRVSDIIKQIGRHIPGLEISAAKLGEVLKLLHATGTCLIERPSKRTWRIRLAELDDVKGALHQKFCEETPTHFHLLPAADPAARRYCGFDHGDLARKPRLPRDAGTKPRSRKAKAGNDAAGRPVNPATAGDANEARRSGDGRQEPEPGDEAAGHRGTRNPASAGSSADHPGSSAGPASANPVPPPPVPRPATQSPAPVKPVPAAAFSPEAASSSTHGWSVLGDRLSKRVASVVGPTLDARPEPHADPTTSGPDPPARASREREARARRVG